MVDDYQFEEGGWPLLAVALPLSFSIASRQTAASRANIKSRKVSFSLCWCDPPLHFPISLRRWLENVGQTCDIDMVEYCSSSPMLRGGAIYARHPPPGLTAWSEASRNIPRRFFVDLTTRLTNKQMKRIWTDDTFFSASPQPWLEGPDWKMIFNFDGFQRDDWLGRCGHPLTHCLLGTSTFSLSVRILTPNRALSCPSPFHLSSQRV